MNRTAHDIFRHAQDGFTPPPGWSPHRWRRSPILACGLTALAVEAALRDIGEVCPVVLRDPELLDAYLDAGRGLLGCSFTGSSSEVLAGLAHAGRRGLATCRIGLATAGDSAPPDVALPEPAPPAHLGHIAFAAVLPVLLGEPGAAPPIPPPSQPALASSLTDTFRRGLIPVFVGTGHGLRARLLRSYWIEFLGRPAFTARFPDWTHDLVWALERSRDARFAFFIESPASDLRDQRFERMLSWLVGRGLAHHVLEPPHAGPGSAVGILLAAADLAGNLARDLRLAPPKHLTFGGRGRVVPQ